MLTGMSVCLIAFVWSAAASDPPDASVPRYDGLTVQEWRDEMKSLVLDSPSAAKAVPGLTALCRDQSVPEQTRAQAAFTLGRIGERATSAIPMLQDLLRAEANTSTKQWSAKALSLFGPLAAESTPELATVADGSDHSVLTRKAAIEALARIGGNHQDAIPTLLQLAAPVSGEETVDRRHIREAAIDSLSLVGPSAAAAVPLLIRATRDDHWPIRYRATLALASIGPSAGVASDALVDLVLFDDVNEVRLTAATALANIGPQGEASLSQLLADQDADVRRMVASVLGQIERPSDESRDALRSALEDLEVNVRLQAAESLIMAEDETGRVIPVLLKGLTEPERQPRMQAYRLIIKLPNHAETLIPELTQLASDERAYVRQAARKAIDQLQRNSVDDQPK